METNKPSEVPPVRQYLVVHFDESRRDASSLWRQAASEYFRAETCALMVAGNLVQARQTGNTHWLELADRNESLRLRFEARGFAFSLLAASCSDDCHIG